MTQSQCKSDLPEEFDYNDPGGKDNTLDFLFGNVIYVIQMNNY